MLNFRHIKKSDISKFRKYIDFSGKMGCEYNLASIYLWSREFDLKVAEYNGALIKVYLKDNSSVWGYCVPFGENIQEAVEAIIAHAEENGEKAVFDYMSAIDKQTLEKYFPDKFVYSRQYDTCDYIYLSEDLANLSGKKYHAKRNHISKFYRTYDNSRFEMIDNHNKGDALAVVQNWCDENNIDYKSYYEYGIIEEALENADEFGMKGALLYVGDVPIAMTLGSAISDICFDINFEKALRQYEGSYAVINNEFAKTLTEYKYLNREEDMGLEGLRKSKLSYHPAIIYDRFRAELKDD